MQNTDDHQAIVTQLNRVSGQIDGVASMISENRSCVDVVQQLLAIRSSINSAAHKYLSVNTISCATTKEDQEKLDMMLKRMFQFEG